MKQLQELLADIKQTNRIDLDPELDAPENIDRLWSLCENLEKKAKKIEEENRFLKSKNIQLENQLHEIKVMHSLKF